MGFSQESNRPGMKFLAWWRKQWYFHWSQGCVPCELLSNFKTLNRFLNTMVVFKCTFWTKKRPTVWLNAQISLSKTNRNHYTPPWARGEDADKAQVKWSHCSLLLCKLSSPKSKAEHCQTESSCKWWGDIYLGQLLAPYQFTCSPTWGFALQ